MSCCDGSPADPQHADPQHAAALPVAPRRARRAGHAPLLSPLVIAWSALFAILPCLFFMLFEAKQWHEAEREYARAVELKAPIRRWSSGQGSGADVDRLVSNTLRAARRSAERGRELALQPFDAAQFAAAEQIAACRQLLGPLAVAPAFAPAHANRLAAHGRPMFLAAVAMLHEPCGRDEFEFHRASNLQQFLAQMTALDALVVVATYREPGAGDWARLSVVSDAWRRLAEQFGRSDEAFERWLRDRGRSPRGG